MPADDAMPDGSRAARPSPKFPRDVDLTLPVSREAVKADIEDVRQAVRETVRKQLSAQRPKPNAEPKLVDPDVPRERAKRGVGLAPGGSLRAEDLPNALLIGKTPDNAGLPIDADATATDGRFPADPVASDRRDSDPRTSPHLEAPAALEVRRASEGSRQATRIRSTARTAPWSSTASSPWPH